MKRIDCKLLIGVLIACLFVAALCGFVLTPFTADLRVFMASANIANYKDVNLFYDAYNTWEIKGVFNRTLMYAIYNISTFFADFGTIGFERVCKLVYAVVIVAVCACTVVLVSDNRQRSRMIALGTALSLYFFTDDYVCQMQAEMTSTLILLLGWAVYVHSSRRKKNSRMEIILAGCCIGAVFFFKSAFLLMSVAFVAAAALYDINEGIRLSLKRFLLLVLGSIIMLVIGFASILILNPDDLNDMLYASMFQETLLSGGGMKVSGICKALVDGCISSCTDMPVLLTGAVALVLNVIACVRRKQHLALVMHAVMWLTPSLFIVISNKYFAYHYFSFVMPSVVELYICAVSSPHITGHRARKLVAKSAMFAALLIYIAYSSLLSPKLNAYITLTKKSYSMNEQYRNIGFNAPVLYLDDGLGAYILGADTYLKYFYPLPLQRISDNSPYRNVKCRTDCRRQIESYNGEYIVVYDKWFFGNGKNNDIRRKILNEYDKIGEIVRYTPQRSVKPTKIDGEADFIYFDFYKRKSDD